jgi:tRNA A37 threonylcarbamoyltransferase TsaD
MPSPPPPAPADRRSAGRADDREGAWPRRCSKPLVAVNHLEAHALTARLTDGVAFPYLMLLVSGGHSQFVLVRGVGDYERWGTTIDDALGEAFDKVAKLLGLGNPGGPEVEKLARPRRSGVASTSPSRCSRKSGSISRSRA